jgi:alkyl hydroperoxide reductase subunit AhpC
MSIQFGQITPDFEQGSTAGRLHLHQYLGRSWGVLFSHLPKDFTPVCTTELAEVARLKPERDKRQVKPITRVGHSRKPGVDFPGGQRVNSVVMVVWDSG